MKTDHCESRHHAPHSEPPPSRVTSKTPRRRRTQEQRSAETRALLLDVTIGCLAELGYAGATAQVIAQRAGLSRGAQLHHFGSKMSLVTQAMEHLFERRLADFRAGFAALPRDGDTLAGAIDLLWSMVAGPAGHAYLELVMAARTDPALRAAMVSVTQRMDAQVEQAFDELFVSPHESFELGWTALFSLLEGLALEKIVRPDDRRVDDVLALLKRLTPLVMSPR